MDKDLNHLLFKQSFSKSDGTTAPLFSSQIDLGRKIIGVSEYYGKKYDLSNDKDLNRFRAFLSTVLKEQGGSKLPDQLVEAIKEAIRNEIDNSTNFDVDKVVDEAIVYLKRDVPIYSPELELFKACYEYSSHVYVFSNTYALMNETRVLDHNYSNLLSRLLKCALPHGKDLSDVLLHIVRDYVQHGGFLVSTVNNILASSSDDIKVTNFYISSRTNLIGFWMKLKNVIQYEMVKIVESITTSFVLDDIGMVTLKNLDCVRANIGSIVDQLLLVLNGYNPIISKSYKSQLVPLRTHHVRPEYAVVPMIFCKGGRVVERLAPEIKVGLPKNINIDECLLAYSHHDGDKDGKLSIAIMSSMDVVNWKEHVFYQLTQRGFRDKELASEVRVRDLVDEPNTKPFLKILLSTGIANDEEKEVYKNHLISKNIYTEKELDSI